MNMTIQNKEKMSILDPFIRVQQADLVNGSGFFALPTLASGLVKIIINYIDTKAFAANPVVAEITFQLLKSGTRRLQTLEFVTALEETGVMLSAQATMDSGMVEFVVLEEQLAALLPLIFEMLNEPAFPENEFERIRTSALQQYNISQRQTHAVARDHFMTRLFEDHPYGTLVTGETIEAITREEILRFHKNHIDNALPVFFVAAHDPDNVRQELNKLVSVNQFPNVVGNNGASSWKGKHTEKHPARIHISMDTGVQSSIRMGKILFGRSHPDYPVAKVVSTLLGGYFSSRLMANLREDKGYTYGVGAGIYTMAEGGYLSVSADVGNEHLEHAIKEIRCEIERLKTEMVEEEELQTVKQYLSGSFLRETDGAFNQLNLLSLLYKHRLGHEWIMLYADRLSRVTVQDIAAFSRKYLAVDEMITVTCGEKNNNNNNNIS